jgi:hypothetical protein
VSQGPPGCPRCHFPAAQGTHFSNFWRISLPMSVVSSRARSSRVSPVSSMSAMKPSRVMSMSCANTAPRPHPGSRISTSVQCKK